MIRQSFYLDYPQFGNVWSVIFRIQTQLHQIMHRVYTIYLNLIIFGLGLLVTSPTLK